MFEFDPEKSAANKAKHGIDFVEAQRLWEDTKRIEVRSRQERHGEPRALVIGRIDDLFWTAIITWRGANVRVISVRRARAEELVDYDARPHERNA
ncbi:MAG: BrnT family toxin [Sphingomonas sp.]|nr:BrnT family toxin [Sphingomonas sp.]